MHTWQNEVMKMKEKKEKQIVMDEPSVKAILSGRKTVIRKPVMPAYSRKAKYEGYRQGYGLWVDKDKDNGDPTGYIKDYSLSPLWWPKPSYIREHGPYKPGDILYVRETWLVQSAWQGGSGSGCKFRYKAGGEDKVLPYVLRLPDKKTVWRPAIFMPKEAARIWLRVTDVNIERLQDRFTGSGGSILDIKAEGIELPEACGDCAEYFGYYGCTEASKCAALEGCRIKFAESWDARYNKKQLKLYGWAANPWVWVVKFDRIEHA